MLAEQAFNLAAMYRGSKFELMSQKEKDEDLLRFKIETEKRQCPAS
ncbi:MAG: hypothetical protein JRJ62_04790 [Deltaproteobacteria bacterium]|nr:hypothetical protein [Deltaproteobacteria bacterium]